MTNQSEPLPFIPPIHDPDALRALNVQVAQHLLQLRFFAEDTMVKLVLGFFERPYQERMAFYLQHEPLDEWLNAPNFVQTEQPDPMTGEPGLMPLPPLMQILPRTCAKMMKDWAEIQKREIKKVEEIAPILPPPVV